MEDVTFEGLQRELQRTSRALGDCNRNLRIEAITEVQKLVSARLEQFDRAVQSSSTGSAATSAQKLNHLFRTALLQLFCTRAWDTTEKVRVVALTLLHEVLRRLPNASNYFGEITTLLLARLTSQASHGASTAAEREVELHLPTLGAEGEADEMGLEQSVPIGTSRLPAYLTSPQGTGTGAESEQSEEIRLLMLQIAEHMLRSIQDPTIFFAHGTTFVNLVCKALVDSFPDARKLACTLVCLFADVAGSSRQSDSLTLVNYVAQLAPPLLANLKHQHSRIRLAALEAIQAVLCMHPDAFPWRLAATVAFEISPSEVGETAGLASKNERPILGSPVPSAASLASVNNTPTEISVHVEALLNAMASAAVDRAALIREAIPFKLQAVIVRWGQEADQVFISDPEYPRQAMMSSALVNVLAALLACLADEVAGVVACAQRAIDLTANAFTALRSFGINEALKQGQESSASHDADYVFPTLLPNLKYPFEEVALSALEAPDSNPELVELRRTHLLAYFAPKLVPVLCSRIVDWNASVRERAAMGLLCVAAGSPSSLVHNLPIVLSTCVKSVMDESSDVRAMISRVLNIIGLYYPPNMWLTILAPPSDGQNPSSASNLTLDAFSSSRQIEEDLAATSTIDSKKGILANKNVQTQCSILSAIAQLLVGFEPQQPRYRRDANTGRIYSSMHYLTRSQVADLLKAVVHPRVSGHLSQIPALRIAAIQIIQQLLAGMLTGAVRDTERGNYVIPSSGAITIADPDFLPVADLHTMVAQLEDGEDNAREDAKRVTANHHQVYDWEVARESFAKTPLQVTGRPTPAPGSLFAPNAIATRDDTGLSHTDRLFLLIIQLWTLRSPVALSHDSPYNLTSLSQDVAENETELREVILALRLLARVDRSLDGVPPFVHDLYTTRGTKSKNPFGTGLREEVPTPNLKQTPALCLAEMQSRAVKHAACTLGPLRSSELQDLVDRHLIHVTGFLFHIIASPVLAKSAEATTEDGSEKDRAAREILQSLQEVVSQEHAAAQIARSRRRNALGKGPGTDMLLEFSSTEAITKYLSADSDQHLFAIACFFNTIHLAISQVPSYFEENFLAMLQLFAAPRNPTQLRVRTLSFLHHLFEPCLTCHLSPPNASSRVRLADLSTFNPGTYAHLIQGVYLPSLVWVAGEVHGSIRLQAIAGLNALFHIPSIGYLTGQKHHVPAKLQVGASLALKRREFASDFLINDEVLSKLDIPNFLKVVGSCTDDDDPSIRLNAGHILFGFFWRVNLRPMSDPEVASRYFAEADDSKSYHDMSHHQTIVPEDVVTSHYQLLLKRLDDSNEEVRLVYIDTLTVFLARIGYGFPEFTLLKPPMPFSPKGGSTPQWDLDSVHLTYCMKTLLPQLNDPSIAIQHGVLTLLLGVLMVRDPDSFEKEVRAEINRGRGGPIHEALLDRVATYRSELATSQID